MCVSDVMMAKKGCTNCRCVSLEKDKTSAEEKNLQKNKINERNDVVEVEKRILVLNYAKRFDLVTSPLQSIILMPSDEIIFFSLI